MSHPTLPLAVSLPEMESVSLASSPHTQCWLSGKVGEHRKGGLGVKAEPEDRAQPKEGQPEAQRSPETDSLR